MRLSREQRCRFHLIWVPDGNGATKTAWALDPLCCYVRPLTWSMLCTSALWELFVSKTSLIGPLVQSAGQDTCCNTQEDRSTDNIAHRCSCHICLFVCVQCHPRRSFSVDFTKCSIGIPPATNACLACSTMASTSALISLGSHRPSTSHGECSRSDFLWVFQCSFAASSVSLTSDFTSAFPVGFFTIYTMKIAIARDGPTFSPSPFALDMPSVTD